MSLQLDEINKKKEYYVYKNPHNRLSNIVVPLYEINRGSNLEFKSYQSFVMNFINVNTNYNRLLLKHSTGSGKTLSAIGISLGFIRYYKINDFGTVFIIGFEGTKVAFKRDFLKFPELGFITKKEKTEYRAMAKIDMEKTKELRLKYEKRFNNRQGNGYFEFIGYKQLFNNVFIIKDNISTANLTMKEIEKYISDGKISVNHEFLAMFKNSLVICDEIHNVYNSLEPNSWGVALQYVLDYHTTLKAVFMSATPLNNNATEIVDLINLMVPSSERVSKTEIFDANNIITEKGRNKITELATGRVSFLINKVPEYFPSYSFTGEDVEGIKYFKFIETKFTDNQLRLINNSEISKFDKIYINDYILPSPDGKFIFTQADFIKIANADPEWKKKHSIDIDVSNNKLIVGPCLELDNLKKISLKYELMMKNILNILKEKKGKLLVYHNYVAASGVLFIGSVLKHNGFIDDFTPITDSTLCVLCGIIKAKCKCDKFKPAKYMLIHGEMTVKNIGQNIRQYNSPNNANGHEYMIMVGSKKIKESYHLSAVRNLYVMSRPSNIPTFIQIIGRCIRNKSHFSLPEDKRHVEISIYASSIEIKQYRERMEDFYQIQDVEKILHTVAVDGLINKGIIQKSITPDDFDIIPYTSVIKDINYTLNDLNTTSFDINFSDKEVEMVIYIIKRAFIQVSRVWTYQDLVEYVKSPSFKLEYDTSVIQDHNINIALNYLTKDMKSKRYNDFDFAYSKDINVLDALYNPNTKLIRLPDNIDYTIVYINKYYILFPVINDRIIISSDSMYRSYSKGDICSTIRITDEYVDNIVSYETQKKSFIESFSNLNIVECHSKLQTTYDKKFHTLFIEDIIVYFNKFFFGGRKDPINHNFYAKMLFVYSKYDMIIFLFALPSKTRDNISDLNKPGSEPESENKRRINLLKQTKDMVFSLDEIFVSEMERYDDMIKLSQDINTIYKNKKIDIDRITNSLPMGHYVEGRPKLYNKDDESWFYDDNWLTPKQYKENDIIIGFDESEEDYINTVFKLRNPTSKIKTKSIQDKRTKQRGYVCSQKGKSFIINICKKLNIKCDDKDNIENICGKIKRELINREISERENDTDVKWFYLHYEQQNYI